MKTQTQQFKKSCYVVQTYRIKLTRFQQEHHQVKYHARHTYIKGLEYNSL